MKEVAELVGIGYRTLQDWVGWYRHGGLSEVLKRIKGHGNQGRPANQIEFARQYLVLAVDVIQLSWAWANRMNQLQLIPITVESRQNQPRATH